MHTFFKIILVLIITGVGAAVTCGGNLYMPIIFGLDDGNYGPEYLLGFWYAEIITIFLWSLYFLFWTDNIKIKNILLIVSGVFLLIGVISAIITY